MQLTSIVFKKDKLTLAEQVEFLEYLESSLKNGLSFAQALEIIPGLWPKKGVLIKKQEALMREGVRFRELLSNLGFSKTVSSQLDLAMEQGNLVNCLSQLVYLEKLKAKQIKKLQAELTYPFTLFVMMIFLLIFMQKFLNEQFSSSDNSGNIVFSLLTGLAIFAVAGILYLLKLYQKQDYHALKRLAKFPIIRKLSLSYIHYLLSGQLGMMLEAGFSFQEIFQFFANQEEDSLQTVIGEQALRRLRNGESIEEVVRKELFLPDNLLIFLKTGASKKNLGQKCSLLAESFFRDLTIRLEKLVVNVQPICFIFIGLCIVGMYLKLLMPIYAVMQSM
ncbi:type II secretion system F family protein [Lactobacillus psittaci]|uniref:type II secretion system F family protein n=1 Tax=Lactobacillus psittaci TaxID=116089 RepID=UPI0004803E0E|nr:type II secretion system F family protein [Lactobacillus psittaci]